MTPESARAWAKDLRKDFPAHNFEPVLLAEYVYWCPVTHRFRKLYTDGIWGIEIDGNAYAYPPIPALSGVPQ
jgi:hypothetical protein